MKKFLRKYLIGIIAVALIFAGGGGAFAAIGSQEADRGDNPIVYEAPDSMKVFPEGKGYKLSKQQMQTYQLPENLKKLEEQNAANGVNPLSPSISAPAGTSPFNPNRSWRPSAGVNPGAAASNEPRITTDLPTKISEKSKGFKEGESLNFYVEAKTYSGVAIQDKDINVKCNDKELTASRSGSGSFTYTAEIAKGENIIVITAEDTVAKKTATLRYTVKAEEKTSGDDDSGDSGGSGGDNGGNSGDNGGSKPDEYKISVSVSIDSVDGISGKSSSEYKYTAKKGCTVYSALKSLYPEMKTDGVNVIALPVLEPGVQYSLSAQTVSELESNGYIAYEPGKANADFRKSIKKESYNKLKNGDFVTVNGEALSRRLVSGWMLGGGYSSITDKLKEGRDLTLSFVITPAQ